jgi:hypothetical protein
VSGVEPLGVYSERLLEVRRRFVLYPDRVAVEARWLLKGRFEHTVRLASLEPRHRRLVIRYRLFWYAGWILAIGTLLFAVAFHEAHGRPIGLGGYVTLTVAVVGGVLLVLTYPLRRLEFVRFDAKSGRGGLDIGAAGSDAATFEAFVRLVEQQVRRSGLGADRHTG